MHFIMELMCMNKLFEPQNFELYCLSKAFADERPCLSIDSQTGSIDIRFESGKSFNREQLHYISKFQEHIQELEKHTLEAINATAIGVSYIKIMVLHQNFDLKEYRVQETEKAKILVKKVLLEMSAIIGYELTEEFKEYFFSLLDLQYDKFEYYSETI